MAASAAVVASDAVGRGSMDSPRDEEEACGVSLHERLVAYVHTLTHGSRRGVCSEHSYARARGAAAACRVRSLLAPVTPRAVPLDVERLSPPPAEPPGAATPTPPDSDDTDAEEGDWEERVRAAALTSLHAQLADAAVDTIHSMRLTRLASTGVARREREREAARRLRRALAPYWSGGAPAWLHATLVRQLPRVERSLYDEAVGELRRAVPRLAARLTGVSLSVSEGVPSAPGGAVGPESSPWLVWVSSGDATLDARWEPRLATLVHTRVLRGAGGAPGAEPAPPEPWCAAAAAAVRSALTDALAEAGSRSIILGGVGAGAAVALVLARGAGGAGRAEGGVRGLSLVAPPLSTAEGARDAADDALAAVRLPLLLVCGARAANCARAAALRVAAAPDRRLLEVRCADHRLRLPPRLRAAKRLPQHALDAALAEEVVRWAVETAEREEEPASPPAAERRRAHAQHRDIVVTDLSEEFSQLPAAPPAPAPAPPAAPAQSSGHAVPAGETRVVSRVSGGTPLLLAPRRAARPAPTLQPADILQLPIVFADDETSPPPTDTNITQGLTVTSGTSEPTDGVNFTRVILAKRGGGASRAARRLLVRRPAPVRLVRAPRP